MALGTYAESTLVAIQVSGIMPRTRSDFTYLWGSAAGQPTDSYDPAGQFIFTLGDCVGHVSVAFTRGGRRFCDAGNLQALTESWTDTAVVQGDGTAQRARGYTLDAPYACSRPGYDPCNIWGGSQPVVVTPTAAKLVLAANRSEVLAGDTVTFTASTSDGSSFAVREWIWVSDVEDGGGVASRASTRPVDGRRLNHLGGPAGDERRRLGYRGYQWA